MCQSEPRVLLLKMGQYLLATTSYYFLISIFPYLLRARTSVPSLPLGNEYLPLAFSGYGRGKPGAE